MTQSRSDDRRGGLESSPPQRNRQVPSSHWDVVRSVPREPDTPLVDDGEREPRVGGT